MLGEGSVNASEPRPSLSAVFASPTASDRFLDLTVTLGTTPLNIAPRLRLVTSPYAFHARTATALLSPNGSSLVSSANGTLTINGAMSATSLTGNGANLTAINAANITAGTLANARTTATADNFGNTLVARDAAAQFQMGNLDAASTHSYAPRQSHWQGAYLEWNKDGSQGSTYLLNQRGGGNGGIVFGEVDTGDGVSERRRIDPSGKVGIGTSGTFGPQHKLHVVGGVAARTTTAADGYMAIQPGDAANTGYLEFWRPGPTRIGYLGYSHTGINNVGLNLENGANFIIADGNVGIGTASPTRARLEIGPYSGSYSIGAYGFAGTGGYYPNQAAGTFSASVFAADQIAASGFVAFSDARIKRSEGRSDGARDLAMLAGIEVTDYFYIDSVAKGKGKQKKVIAQQLEAVYPQAVSRLTEVVPDLYQKARVKDGWVTLATSLKNGERVRLIGEKKEGIHEVLEVTPEKFRTGYAADSEQVFVYGREVNDFRSVDYDAISMLNVSATQELARRLVKVEQRETHLSALEETAARVEKLEREMAELKLLVARLAGQLPPERPAAEAGPASVNPAAKQ